MEILENVQLAPHTTFWIGGPARYFCTVHTLDELLEATRYAKQNNLPLLVLSGGSNMLISDNGFNGLVIKLEMAGLETIVESEGECILKIASGEVWDDVVKYAVEKGYWGIENLSHIPGRTGAFAVQNVGAYGQEAKDVIVSIDALDLQTDTVVTLQASDCKFGYRQSIFNRSQRGRYIILYTRIRLHKTGTPNLRYRDLAHMLSNIEHPTLLDIRNAIIEIRDKKFPFPVNAKTGNSGSWFKNITLSKTELDTLRKRITLAFDVSALSRLEGYVDMLTTDSGTKIPAAFLIDICGLKGLHSGGAKINPAQPLVIVNESGTAKAVDVLEIVRQVRTTVYKKTGIELETEPELIGFTEAERADALAVI